MGGSHTYASWPSKCCISIQTSIFPVDLKELQAVFSPQRIKVLNFESVSQITSCLSNFLPIV